MLKGSCDFVREEVLIVCNHPAKFGDPSHCGGGDITYLIYPVTLQDHVIKGFRYFTLIIGHQLVKFGGHWPCGSRYIVDLNFPVTLKYQVIKGPCDFM